MKKKKYLPLYYMWMEVGEIPYRSHKGTSGGLCGVFGNNELLLLCLPEVGSTWCYWGFDDSDYRVYNPQVGFTPTRQNIVLLMAALNGEFDSQPTIKKKN